MGVPLVGLMCGVDEVDVKVSQMDYAGGGMVGQMQGTMVLSLFSCTTWSSRKGVSTCMVTLILCMMNGWERCFLN